MHLLDDMRLIGNEILAPPTTGKFELSSTRPASYEIGDSLLQFMEVQLESIVNRKLEK